MKEKVSVFWFRRDLRLADNAGLWQALSCGVPVLPVFIFDRNILSRLDQPQDRRVDYIHQALTDVHSELRRFGSGLKTYYGDPLEVFRTLANEYNLQTVYCNRDYEPIAIRRDEEICRFLKSRNIAFRLFKDQVIFDQNDILKDDGTPYTVYTPYSKKWKSRLQHLSINAIETNFRGFYQQPFSEILSLDEIGFKKTDLVFERPLLQAAVIDEYDKYRDYPALQKTSQLGTALRFGTISIRKCVSFAVAHNQVWLSELIWREFFMQILYHFPHVVWQSFRKQYDLIRWRNDETEFARWCDGRTGYPMVDAGMRQLNQTGYMHNRARMIAAGFLCKHLLIDWRWGEAYFARKLNDYDLSANNGNWQWAAGSGCDAAPYFRVFNPAIQMAKFDPNGEYIKKWLPEFGTDAYPKPVVEHRFASDRALKVYSGVVSEI